MTLQSIDGAFLVPIGFNYNAPATVWSVNATTMDAANEAHIILGHVVTSDGGSHTIDTTGSSSIQWRTGAITFANGSTVVKVGLAAVDTGSGPSGRAANASNVVSFDVSKSLTGGGGGITANAWQTHVPDTGTKTIANGDFIALAIQMTARAGADSVLTASSGISASLHRPVVTAYVGGSYSNQAALPNAIITFSDGALGYFHGSEIFSTLNTRTWNNTATTKEYGQLFKLPFPTKIYGIHGHVDADGDVDAILYSDPLGTPVAEKTVSLDLNTVAGTAMRKFVALFPAPYTTTAEQVLGVAFKPTSATDISTHYKTLGDAAHRIADPWGLDGYGISRDTGAFANANSSLDHYSIGPLIGAFEDSAGSGGFVPALRGPMG